MKLDNNAHSVFLLHYHLVLVIKYRRKVFDDDISNRAKEIFEYIAPNYNITLQEWNHDKDHVHILFKAHPNSEISKFINAYKSASSRLLKKEFPQIRQKLWKEYFWSQSFCLLTTGEMIDAFEYHIVEPDRIQSDMEDLEKKLIETDRATKAKEVVNFLDDYARSKGWNCYFGNLEVCKSSEILRAVLLSCKEKHPRFVSFYLGNSIETIKKQIEGIRLI